MQSEATVRRRLRDLRKFIESDDSDEIEKRIAHEVEMQLTRVITRVVGWPPYIQSIRDAAHIIKKDKGLPNTA
jgi:hypothetical protein